MATKYTYFSLPCILDYIYQPFISYLLNNITKFGILRKTFVLSI